MQITEQNAKAYVANYFAKAEYETPVTCDILYTEPCADTVDESENHKAIDVFFRLSDCPKHVNRFTVWIERYPNVAPFIYGEW